MSVGFLAVIGISIQAVQEPATATNGNDHYVNNEEDKVTKDYNVYALPMPDNLNFAGERVPIEDPDIYERMDRELLVNTYWQSNALLLMKRANKYFPVIEPILKEYGVPEDFKYVAVIESSLTQAVSPAKATGFWQLMEGTGKDYKLEINSNVDERYHIEKSTRAAAEYLLRSKKQFGSWTMAAAAYNAGNLGVSRQVDRQGVSGYYDLLLNEETGRYVFRILALKEIMSNPRKYGFNFNDEHLYKPIPTYTVKVDSPVKDFAEFSKLHGINYKILKLHNPWLREAHLSNTSKKVYEIVIPQKGIYRSVE